MGEWRLVITTDCVEGGWGGGKAQLGLREGGLTALGGADMGLDEGE